MAGVMAVLSKLSAEVAERRQSELAKGNSETKLFDRMADQGDAYVPARGDTAVIAEFLSRRSVNGPMDPRAKALVQERIDAILNHREWKRRYQSVQAEIEAMPTESEILQQIAKEDLAIAQLSHFWMQKKRDLLAKLEARRAKLTERTCTEESFRIADKTMAELAR